VEAISSGAAIAADQVQILRIVTIFWLFSTLWHDRLHGEHCSRREMEPPNKSNSQHFFALLVLAKICDIHVRGFSYYFFFWISGFEFISARVSKSRIPEFPAELTSFPLSVIPFHAKGPAAILCPTSKLGSFFQNKGFDDFWKIWVVQLVLKILGILFFGTQNWMIDVDILCHQQKQSACHGCGSNWHLLRGGVCWNREVERGRGVPAAMPFVSSSIRCVLSLCYRLRGLRYHRSFAGTRLHSLASIFCSFRNRLAMLFQEFEDGSQAAVGCGW
jgi:hypothetical protein